MKVLTAIVLVSTFMLPLRAEASWFEFCRMEGRIESVTPDATDDYRMFDLRVAVSAAQPVEGAALEGYTDCSEHVGKSLELRMRLSRQHDRLVEGDRIVFTRSVVDSFDDPITGKAASSVRVELLAHAPSADN